MCANVLFAFKFIVYLAGTIIPIRRQTPVVQLTPISSCAKGQAVQNSIFTPSAQHHLPVLLPKQSQVGLLQEFQ